MNRSAYLTTGLAIKLLSRLSKADVGVHGQEHIPTGPTIFVINHFTRVETVLLPYYIYNLTHKPAWSLAAASLFRGGLGKFFDMVGAVSTADPQRDQLIVRSLLTGEANWIIFPEGSMVKTKKIMTGGQFMIAHPTGTRPPRTGAAALALRAELFRAHLLRTAEEDPGSLPPMLEALEIESMADLCREQSTIVPVNLTYYPIRTAENIASTITAKLVKDIPERMVEEIMTEGTMLLSGVDLDIRFGKPIAIADYLEAEWLQLDMRQCGITGFTVPEELRLKMRQVAQMVMQRYMHAIYAMTTVNHEHLFASLLRSLPGNRQREDDFLRRAFFAATLLSDGQGGHCHLHKSLQADQAHLLTDDRYQKYDNFFQLAKEKGILERRGYFLYRNRHKLALPLGFHNGRFDNPVEVMANEVEPLQPLLKMLNILAWLPMPLLRLRLANYLFRRDQRRCREECSHASGGQRVESIGSGMPFLLPALRRRMGVVLVHSYLAVPEEVRALAATLRRRGLWVYAPRLPGHGTSPEDLAERQYHEWVAAVENAYVLMSTICHRVVVGGMAVGGSLALDLAARCARLAGVFAICPPLSLHDYSASFMPGKDVWNRLRNRMRRGEAAGEYLPFTNGNPHVNYPRNPLEAIREVGEMLEAMAKSYGKITAPALILQAAGNPIVAPKGSRKLYEAIGSTSKEFTLLNFDRHIIVNGEGCEQVFEKVGAFIRSLETAQTVLAESTEK
jgi:esterase/lipase/1-acyl-sn-glycerol-3-phosphate acyltransferase